MCAIRESTGFVTEHAAAQTHTEPGTILSMFCFTAIDSEEKRVD